MSGDSTSVTMNSTNFAQERDRRRSGWLVRDWNLTLATVLIVATGLAAYWSSFAGAFLFDDRAHILGWRRLKTLWPLWDVVARRRPVVDYSLAINHAIGGENVWGYHAVNLAAHILAALTLYGIIRRTLRPRTEVGAPSAGAGCSPVACAPGSGTSWLALVAALIWVVHPLQTQSVTYIVQRAESLMGLFYLLTLYCVIRGADSPAQARGHVAAVLCWYVAAFLSCALGMGSKAVTITAPLMVLLYDRVFISKSFADMLRRRWVLYLGLAATWYVLWHCGLIKGVLNTSAKSAHVGFGFKGITPLEYALTEFGVLVRYLRLSLWPHPLCLDYYWPVARTVGSILPPATVIVVLLIAVLRAFRRTPALGFLGAWFFVTLAPTSSFIPIKDPLFEHRMYLPLAAVVVLIVIATDRALRHFAACLSLGNLLRRSVATGMVMTVVGSLAYGTFLRNEDYHNEVSMWRDVLAKRPNNPRAAENLGTYLLGEGRMEEAMKALREAVRISPRSANVRNALGFGLVAYGRLDEAIESFREAVRLRPTFARAHLNLGNALSDKGRVDEAMEHFRAAVWISPRYTEARLDLGTALLTQGRIEEAIDQYREILRLEPRHSKALGNLGTALLANGQIEEAVETFLEALQIDERAYKVYNSLGVALATMGMADEAAAGFRQALKLKPDFASAHCNLARCLAEEGDMEGAVRHYRSAIQTTPLDPNAHFGLGVALAKQGDVDAAIEEFRQTLSIKPDHAQAREALDAVIDTK